MKNEKSNKKKVANIKDLTSKYLIKYAYATKNQCIVRMDNSQKKGLLQRMYD